MEDPKELAREAMKTLRREVRKTRTWERRKRALLIATLLMLGEVGGVLWLTRGLGQAPSDTPSNETFFENVTVQNASLGVIAELSSSLTYFVPQSTIDEKVAVVPWGQPGPNSGYEAFYVNITGAHEATANGSYYSFRPQSCAVTLDNPLRPKSGFWSSFPYFGDCLLWFDYSGNYPLHVSAKVTTFNITNSSVTSTNSWLGTGSTSEFLAVSPAESEVNYIAFLENLKVASAAIAIALLSIFLQVAGIAFQINEGPRKAEEELEDEVDNEWVQRLALVIVDEYLKRRGQSKDSAEGEPKE